MSFRKVDLHQSTQRELQGKLVHFAVYESEVGGEVKFLVSEVFARFINCGKPLEDFLAHARAAILDSAARHGNPTAPRKQ